MTATPSGDDRTRAAAEAVQGAREALVGVEHDGVRVQGLVHYGAVELRADLLVVWVLLAGRPDDELPEWFEITPASPGGPSSGSAGGPTPGTVDRGWLLGLRDVVVRELAVRGWPDPEGTRVMTDSAHRVAAHGGLGYFR